MGNNFSFAAFLIVTQALTTITILVKEFISVLIVLTVTICIESRKLSLNVLKVHTIKHHHCTKMYPENSIVTCYSCTPNNTDSK